MFQASGMGRTTLVLMAVDANFPVLVIAGYGLLRFGNPISVLLDSPWLLLTALAFPGTYAAAELYNLRRRLWTARVLLRVAVATLAVVGFCAVAAHLTGGKADSRDLFGVLAVAMGAEALLVRSAAAVRARRARVVHSALVVGAGWAGRAVIDCTLREPGLRTRVAGMIDDDPLLRNEQYKGITVVGTSAGLVETAGRLGVGIVVNAASPPLSAGLIRGLLELKLRGVEVLDMPAFVERATGQIPIRHVEDSWFLYSGGFELLHRPWLRRFKRAFDVLASFVGLVLSAPLMGVVAVLVKLDSKGPVFYRQERVGQGEKPFQVVKFRSMREDAESASGPVWASVRDYRVTRVGKWLRLTRIDEIPQFINVLNGDMSFIGPRPERPFFVEKLKQEIPYYAMRFAVKPGLTGWAQVQYRYGASVEDAVEKLKYDLYYIKNMSAPLDLWIALKTLKVVASAQGN